MAVAITGLARPEELEEKPQSRIRPRIITQPVTHDSEDPAIWIHPTDTSRRLIIATDELGMHAVENRMSVHDLHATILHLAGIDHERLTYRYSGRDFRLTDVHGEIAHQIIA